MLEICVGCLVWSINLGSELKLPQILSVSEETTALERVYLAQGRPYESDYSREAQRERERRDIWNHGGDSDREEAEMYRERYDADNYRIFREPNREGNRDDADDYRREVETDRIYRNSERRDRDRYHRNTESDRIFREPD